MTRHFSLYLSACKIELPYFGSALFLICNKLHFFVSISFAEEKSGAVKKAFLPGQFLIGGTAIQDLLGDSLRT